MLHLNPGALIHGYFSLFAVFYYSNSIKLYNL